MIEKVVFFPTFIFDVGVCSHCTVSIYAIAAHKGWDFNDFRNNLKYNFVISIEYNLVMKTKN